MGFVTEKIKYGGVRCFSFSYKTSKLYRHLLKTDNFVNFLRSMQFSKIVYKEPSTLGLISMWSQNFAQFCLYFMNSAGFAQKCSQAVFYEGPHLWRLLDAF